MSAPRYHVFSSSQIPRPKAPINSTEMTNQEIDLVLPLKQENALHVVVIWSELSLLKLKKAPYKKVIFF